jgi:hypothetical protein
MVLPLLCGIPHGTIHTAMRMLWSLMYTAAAVYLALLLGLFVFQARLIYLPRRVLVATPTELGLRYEDVYFQTADGLTLHGWFVPRDSTERVLLFFHGNAGNVSHRLESLHLFYRLGWSVFLIDYRGYGQSQGSPSEQGTYQDALSAWRYLTEERRLPASQVVIFGRSLGGSIAVWLAAQTSPAALIAESAFTSLPELAATLYPWFPARFLARYEYDTRRWIQKVRCPVLIIHSREDELVPFAHAQELFLAAQEPKSLLAIRGSHNHGFRISGTVYLQGLGDFMATLP